MKKYLTIFVILMLVGLPIITAEEIDPVSPQNIETYSTVFIATSNDDDIEQGDGATPTWEWDSTGTSGYNVVIYKNGTLDTNTTKANPKPSKIGATNIIDGSETLGIYNITISLTLNYSNGTQYNEVDSVFYNVVPQENPKFLDAPNTYIEIENGNTTSDLIWEISDLSPATYSILKNGSVLPDADAVAWTTSPYEIIYDDHEMIVGETYNYTIIITDGVGLQSVNTTYATIIENPAPIVSDTSVTTTFAKSDVEKTFTWFFDDNNLVNYTIFLDQIEFQIGTFIDDSVTVDLSSLDYGTFELKIIAEDTLNQTVENIVEISIIDILKPQIITNPVDQILVYGGTVNNLVWNVSDDNHDSYIIYDNGTIIDSGDWISNINIQFTPTINQVLGFHNITITIMDTYGNMNTDFVNITVISINTLLPEATIESEVYVDSYDDVLGYWSSGSTNVTGATIAATLWEDDVLIKTVLGTININGRILLNLSYSGISEGNYTWMIEFSKVGYESQKLIHAVQVHQIPIIADLFLNENMIQGQDYQLNLTLSFGEIGSGSDALYLNQLFLPSGKLKNKEVQVMIFYIDLNGDTQSLTYTRTTDNNGFARFIISATDTREITKITGLSISTISNGYEISLINSNITFDAITIIGETPSSNSVLVVILSIIIILGIASVGGYIILSNPLKRMKPIDHIDHLQSIQMIILSNSNGIPIFEKSFTELETDSTMIAGLSSAISTFLDEFIENNEKGLEVIERDNLSLISHRSEDTVFTVVSSPKLPQSYQSQVVKVHTDLISEIPIEKLQQSYSSSNDNLDNVVLDSLHQNGIRVNLLLSINYSADRFKEFLKFGAPNMNGAVDKHKELLKNLNFININLTEYFQLMRLQTELSDDKIAELLFGLDDLGLLTIAEDY